MSTKRTPTFLALCLAGEESTENFDDYLDRWHDSGPEEQRGPAEFLGFTLEQFAQWVWSPVRLASLIEEIRHAQTTRDH